MRALIALIVFMSIAIVVALGFVVYGLQRNLGGGEGTEDFGDLNLGLANVCEIVEAQITEDRILIRTTGLAERGCQKVFVLDAESGRILGQITASPVAPN
ncbi:MAG: hypothetical protein R3245_09620 [Kiloniellales bacterium]|nr:hypothetical protein [Kiloniellales bacterium]